MRSARECRPARNDAWYSDCGVPWARGMFRVWPSPAPVPVSSLRPGSGIERKAMDREEPDPLAVVEDLLGAVAVVHVEIDDQHAV